MTDPFSLLGVDENANDDEIKRRYLALVRDFPPDREPERFQIYRAAFESLRTERQRLAAKLLASHNSALTRLKTSALPPPEARQPRRVSQAQVTALLIEGVQQAMARWREVSQSDAPPTTGE